MDDLIKANLNLYAVLQNLEDLVAHDPQAASLVRGKRIALQFRVRGGPSSYVRFDGERCSFGRGVVRRPDVVLGFVSPGHLNSMFDGKAMPVPMWGLHRLGFLTKEFTKLTDRLEYFLKPTDELLRDPAYLELNTRLTMNTAAYAIPELARLDPVGKLCAPKIPDGVLVMKVMPDGPAVSLRFDKGAVEATKGETPKPMAMIRIKDVQTANDFFSGKADTFAAVASGDVLISGKIPMVDTLSLILDRIPRYLS